MSPSSTTSPSTSPAGSNSSPSAGANGTETVPVVGPREPCPCGSGKRYKICHGRRAQAVASTLVLRPFEHLPGEAGWVAMKEILPAASATIVTGGTCAEHGIEAGEKVTVASVLPGAVPGLRRADGSVLIALQTSVSSGDASRDAAASLVRALAAQPGQALEPGGLPGSGPRLQDLLDDSPLTVTVHDGFGFWTGEGADDLDAAAQEALEEASASVDPTAVVPGVEYAFWTRAGGRELLRWVLPHDEQALLDALGRLAASGTTDADGLAVVPGARFLGAFRAHGLVAPVWELPADTGAQGLQAPAAAFGKRLDAALALTGPLSAQERRARAGVVSRQLTLR